VSRHAELVGRISIPGIEQPIQTTSADYSADRRQILVGGSRRRQNLSAYCSGERRGQVHHRSIDGRTDEPQTPPELLVILAALADEKILCKRSRRNLPADSTKGSITLAIWCNSKKEFSEDLAVIAFAIKQYGLPANLKLSVHSGSDKFSIYAPIRRAIAKQGAGLHIKTAGTTWLEELIGLAEGGASGLKIAKEIYAGALDHVDELCAPYASVIDIDRQNCQLRRKSAAGALSNLSRPYGTIKKTRRTISTCGNCCTSL